MFARLPRLPIAVTLAAAVMLTGCTSSSGGNPNTNPPFELPTGTESNSSESPPAPPQAKLQQPTDATTVLTGDADKGNADTANDGAARLALEASQTLFVAAPVVVLASSDDDSAQLRAASAAVALGAPLLLAGDDVADELVRLGSEAALTFGNVELGSEADGVTQVPAPDDDDTLAQLLGRDVAASATVNGGEQVHAIIGLTRGTFTPLTFERSEDNSARGGAKDESSETEDADDTSGADGLDAAADETPGTPTDVGLPETALADPLADVLVAATGAQISAAAITTAVAAGIPVTLMPDGDPRATSATVAAVADAEAKYIVGIGSAFKDAETLQWRIAAAATGVELPGGGQLVLPGKRYVALYGTPSSKALGVLGEQDVPKTVARAEKLAKSYDELSKDSVIPALEIIATVASAGAGDDDNYSNELPAEQLRPLIDAAHEAGQYVILDLQPGRASFLEQAKQYSELLELPHVGLALDPEWNLGPKEKHLIQIGSATAEEINEVVDWLADFTRERELPQKMLVLHQFQVRMIQSIADVDQSRSELAVLVHADGQGSQPAKQDTWRTLHANAPEIEWWGWKNFYDEDSPMLTPEQTVEVEPFPNFISYQ